MNSGLLFYWFSWMLVIGILFFMKKDRKRKIFAYWVLFVIICSDFHVTLNNYSITVSFFIIMIGSVVWMARLPRLMYQLLCSFTVAILYAAIHFWLLIAPVWLFLPMTMIITLSCSLFIVLLVKESYYRSAICLFGISCGEIIYNITMGSYGFHRLIGEMIYFDYIAGILLIFTVLSILQYTTAKINSLLKQKQIEVAK